MSRTHAVLFSLLSWGCFKKPPATEGLSPGARRATLDLWAAGPAGTKLYVEADLGDGEDRLFLVDTGADISAMSTEVAMALGLEPVVQRGGVAGDPLQVGQQDHGFKVTWLGLDVGTKQSKRTVHLVGAHEELCPVANLVGRLGPAELLQSPLVDVALARRALGRLEGETSPRKVENKAVGVEHLVADEARHVRRRKVTATRVVDPPSVDGFFDDGVADTHPVHGQAAGGAQKGRHR